MNIIKTKQLSHAVRELNAVVKAIDDIARTLMDLCEDAAEVEVRVAINGEDVSVQSAAESRVKQALPELLEAELARLEQRAAELKADAQTALAQLNDE